MGVRNDSWNKKYAAAAAYRRRYGNLSVPRNYVTADGIKLGEWIHTQRLAAAGTGSWKITPQQRKKLSSLGMRWQKDTAGREPAAGLHSAYMKKAAEKAAETGTPEFSPGTREAAWADSLRYAAAGRPDLSVPPSCPSDVKGRLSAASVAELNGEGFRWDTDFRISAQRHIDAVREYRRTNGTADVPYGYVTDGGCRTGEWLARQRRIKRGTSSGTLREETEKELTRLGVSWNPKKEHSDALAAEAAAWFAEHGTDTLPPGRTGRWVAAQKRAAEAGRKNRLRECYASDTDGSPDAHSENAAVPSGDGRSNFNHGKKF